MERHEAHQRRHQEKRLRVILHEEKDEFRAYSSDGQIAADIILRAIVRDDQISADRYLIAGSVGKRTSLGIDHCPDFDLVILLNEGPGEDDDPFDGAVDVIAQVVKNLPNKFKFKRQCRFSVSCNYSGNYGLIKFDIVPGFNFLTNAGDDPHHAFTQLEKTLSLMSESPGHYKRYLSGSLAEAALDFVFEQTDFACDVVKLAKLWNRVKVGDNFGTVSGRSSIIELMAIKAAQEEEEEYGKDADLLGAFTRFLQMFAQRRKRLRIIFPFKCNPNHPAYKQYERMTKKKKCGIVLDPVNPYNNLLDAIAGHKWTIFHGKAIQSLFHIYKEGSKNSKRKLFSLEKCFC